MASKRILIVEDDHDVAEMLLMYFSSQQYEVYHADDGADGIEIARTRFPNLILLDVMLPSMDGYQVCKVLRTTSLTKHIPVIFLTQKDGRADIVEGLQLGADDYIPKPFDIDELRLRVANSIDRATRESLHEPRTGLPAGPMVEDERQYHEREGGSFNEFWFELYGHSAYGDVYGFMAANEVMAFAAKLLREILGEKGTENDFIGIVDDRFFVLTYAEDAAMLQAHIAQEFAKGVRAFYTFIDVDRGGVLLNEGQENEKLVGLMELRLLNATV